MSRTYAYILAAVNILAVFTMLISAIGIANIQKRSAKLRQDFPRLTAEKVNELIATQQDLEHSRIFSTNLGKWMVDAQSNQDIVSDTSVSNLKKMYYFVALAAATNLALIGMGIRALKRTTTIAH